MGWGPIPWLLMSEIFPLHVKGVTTGVCVLTNWFMAFLVTKAFSSVMVSADACLPSGCQQRYCQRFPVHDPECKLRSPNGLDTAISGVTWSQRLNQNRNLVYDPLSLPSVLG